MFVVAEFMFKIDYSKTKVKKHQNKASQKSVLFLNFLLLAKKIEQKLWQTF